jgi:hypothetical protein
MAADKTPQTTTSEQATARASQVGRDRLAMLVVVGSFITLLLLVSALVGLANQTSSGEAAKTAFTTVLPVLAGWVGTVLAFTSPRPRTRRASRQSAEPARALVPARLSPRR